MLNLLYFIKIIKVINLNIKILKFLINAKLA